MRHMFGVSRSGDDHWTQLGLSQHIPSYVDSDRRIRMIFAGDRQLDGAPRFAKTLQYEGFQCSESRIARRMQVLSLWVIQAKKFKVTTDSNHSKSVDRHFIKQGFHTVIPNSNGPVTSPTFGLSKGGCIWPWRRIPIHEASWGGS